VFDTKGKKGESYTVTPNTDEKNEKSFFQNLKKRCNWCSLCNQPSNPSKINGLADQESYTIKKLVV
jgi:hypothetical protein